MASAAKVPGRSKRAGAAGRLRSLEALGEIAKRLNSRADVEAALDEVLSLVVSLLGLRTAWLFLSGEPGRRLRVAAAHALPPALSTGEWRPLRQGWCDCFEQFRDGSLREAVNIVECSRLDGAPGDREGLVFHASVPLRGASGTLGILNVASPGRALFDPEALHLLTAVGEHLGTALERSRLFVRERQRARLFEAVERVSRELGSEGAQATPGGDPAAVAARFAQVCRDAFQVDAVSVALGDERLRLAAVAMGAEPQTGGKQEPAVSWRAGQEVPERSLLWLGWRFGRVHLGSSPGHGRRRSPAGALPGAGSWGVVPVQIRSRRLGAVLLERAEAGAWPEPAEEALRALGDHLALALESSRLRAAAQELARQEERHRMARELHDAVSQELFSLTMVLAAARGAARSGDPRRVDGTLEQAEARARASLAEMRRLVHQLRPINQPGRTAVELRKALEEFARYHPLAQGGMVRVRLDGASPGDENPSLIGAEQFEALWMVGREALHNALRHAAAGTIRVRVAWWDERLHLTVADDGVGFDAGAPRPHAGHGLSIMAERCALAGGALRVRSRPGGGTAVAAWVPLMRAGGCA